MPEQMILRICVLAWVARNRDVHAARVPERSLLAMADIIEKTDEQIEPEVRHILSFRKGRENRISRWELVERVFGREAAANRGNNNPYDRKIREVIAKYRDIDLIVSSSSVPGYWIAADMQDIETIAEEYVKRSREMEEKARNLRRRGAEKFGPQMPLFKQQ